MVRGHLINHVADMIMHDNKNMNWAEFINLSIAIQLKVLPSFFSKHSSNLEEASNVLKLSLKDSLEEVYGCIDEITEYLKNAEEEEIASMAAKGREEC